VNDETIDFIETTETTETTVADDFDTENADKDDTMVTFGAGIASAVVAYLSWKLFRAIKTRRDAKAAAEAEIIDINAKSNS
jgi:hypothetical protein